jgi:tetratricopeptide (TPR) repeat protein
VTANHRIEFLENLVAAGRADSFARYALALEYDKIGRTEAALLTFETLRQNDPEYLPMYLMSGGLLSKLGQPERAVEWLKAGILLAERKGDQKAASELSGLLSELAA